MVKEMMPGIGDLDKKDDISVNPIKDIENQDGISLELFGKPKGKDQTESILTSAKVASLLGISEDILKKNESLVLRSNNKDLMNEFIFELYYFLLPEEYHGNNFEYSFKKINGEIFYGTRFKTGTNNIKSASKKFDHFSSITRYLENKQNKQAQKIADWKKSNPNTEGYFNESYDEDHWGGGAWSGGL